MPHRDQFQDDNSFLQALRDYFAGQALVGLAANREIEADDHHIAIASYILADAMLAKR